MQYILKTPGDINDYLEIENHTDLSVAKNIDGSIIGLTVHTEFRPTVLLFRNLDVTYVKVLGKASPGMAEWQFVMHKKNIIGNNSMRVYLYNLEGGEGTGSNFEDVWDTTTWVKVTMVVDPDNTYIFKNGIKRDCDNYSGNITVQNCGTYLVINPQHSSSSLRVGRDGYSGIFEGEFKNLRIYNKPLSDLEVYNLSNGIFNDTNNLVLWHDYTLGHAQDLSGHNHHGILNGNATFIESCFELSCNLNIGS